MKELRFPQTVMDRQALADLNYAANPPAVDVEHYSSGVVTKPWGCEYEVSRNATESVWNLHLFENSETSMHCHLEKETMLIVTSGEVEFSTLVGTVSLGIGARILIERGVFHRTATRKGAMLVEIESPPNKADLVRLSDKYGREGTGYAGR